MILTPAAGCFCNWRLPSIHRNENISLPTKRLNHWYHRPISASISTKWLPGRVDSPPDIQQVSSLSYHLARLLQSLFPPVSYLPPIRKESGVTLGSHKELSCPLEQVVLDSSYFLSPCYYCLSTKRHTHLVYPQSQQQMQHQFTNCTWSYSSPLRLLFHFIIYHNSLFKKTLLQTERQKENQK